MVNKKLLALKKVLLDLEAKNGMATPEAVLQKAEPENSPIHTLFDWDEAHAANEHRLWQARHYIKQIQVEIMGREIQGFYNIEVNIEDVKTQGYYSLPNVLSKPELKKAVIREALQNLEYWQKKYKDFVEVSKLVNLKELRRLQADLLQQPVL